jgi:SPP1 family predicted phage head-tail adaptor
MRIQTISDQSPTISRFRRRLTIEAPVETADGAGGADVAFAPIGAAWAQVEWLRGDERWRADRFEQAGQIRITLRHRTDLNAAMRFRDGTRLFAIKALGDPDGAARRTICLCEEILP